MLKILVEVSDLKQGLTKDFRRSACFLASNSQTRLKCHSKQFMLIHEDLKKFLMPYINCSKSRLEILLKELSQCTDVDETSTNSKRRKNVNHKSNNEAFSTLKVKMLRSFSLILEELHLFSQAGSLWIFNSNPSSVRRNAYMRTCFLWPNLPASAAPNLVDESVLPLHARVCSVGFQRLGNVECNQYMC